MDLPCPVHEGRRAHRGCRFCRRPICRLCELKMRGHLYCSPRCARDDGRLAFWRPVQDRLWKPVSPRLAIAVLALGVTAPMLLALKTVGELDRLALEAPAPAPWKRPPAARIETVSEGAGSTRIEGSASPGSAVFLFAAEGFVASAPVVNGRFRFEAVREKGPYRVGILPLSAEAAVVEELPGAAADSVERSPALETSAPAPDRSVDAAASAEIGRSSPPLAAPRSPDSKPSSPASGSRSTALSVPDMTRGPADRQELVVSFDAGASARGARQILDALRARGIRTTIFLTGDFIRRHPDLARQVASEGHEVGNHTDSHPHLTTYAEDGRQATRAGVDRAFLAKQLSETAKSWRDATGQPMAPLWRAPYGEQNGQIRGWAALEGYWHVGWTGGRAGLDGLDWVTDPASRSYRSAGGVVERLVSRAENGGIILLHLGSDREDPVAPRIPELLDALSARGFRFARASEFLARLGMNGERLLAFAAAGRSAGP